MSKEINKEILDKLKLRIIKAEQDNHKTKSVTDSQMVEKLRNLIKVEVDKDDN